MTEFSLIVMGKPQGKARPRFTRTGRVFTEAKTKQAEAAILAEWERAGSVRLDGPIELDVLLFHKRPAGHFTSKGLLSTAGRRQPIPDNQKPDIDNALKLVMDALNGSAWSDDVRVVRASVTRWWSHPGDPACTVLSARTKHVRTGAPT